MRKQEKPTDRKDEVKQSRRQRREEKRRSETRKEKKESLSERTLGNGVEINTRQRLALILDWISTEHSPKLQIRSHSYLRAVSEVSINRSLDSLDPAGLLASPKFRSRNESYMRAMSTISQVSGTQRPVALYSQPLNPLYLYCYVQYHHVSEVEVNGQIESVCESVFSEMESQAVDALDLPIPSCFRMRSHSYVRAIEKGCSQEEEEAGVRRTNTSPRTTTVRTIQSSTEGAKEDQSPERISSVFTVDDPHGSCMLKPGRAPQTQSLRACLSLPDTDRLSAENARSQQRNAGDSSLPEQSPTVDTGFCQKGHAEHTALLIALLV
ncbi:Disks large-associated protein 1 [Liparis tanakae]|uniref:Disks large-associated protein 1 n=1 Tax=Liparis tanakae TaxID=230148 RepID=A0A4Z2I5V3_9TELE|nr:Disks large-associated protein 1 [Liparis tanakae]